MPFWALLPCLLRPFCGEVMADHVWKGQVWNWRCGCLKGEKTKEWENEELIFNAQNSFSILLKSQFLSSTLGVLSSKSPTFQAQEFNVSSSNAWCFISQKLNVSSSNAWCFIFQKSNFPSSILDVLSLKSPSFQAQESKFPSSKTQISSLESCCPTLLCLLFCSFFF